MKETLTEYGSFLERIMASDKLVEIFFKLAELAVILLAGLLILKVIVVVVRKMLGKSKIDPVLYAFIINSIKVLAVIVLITMCLGTLGVQMSTIVAVIGAAGAAIALALRDSLANVAGGMMIILTQPFRQGDLIDVGEFSGQVESIDLFLTTLKTYDNRTITIPNGLINTSILVNHSRETNRRVDCVFGISYGSDLEQAKDVMRRICQKNERIASQPEPTIGVAGYEDGTVLLDLKVWCKTEDYWDVQYYLEEQIKLAFDEAGIQLPRREIYVQPKS